REPVDVVDIRPLHHAEELAGIGAQTLHVAPLPLRIDGIEGEARLPRSREAGDDHQPLPGNVQIDVLEVVLPCPSNDNAIVHTVLMVLDAARAPGDMPNEEARARRRTSLQTLSYRIGRESYLCAQPQNQPCLPVPGRWDSGSQGLCRRDLLRVSAVLDLVLERDRKQ